MSTMTLNSSSLNSSDSESLAPVMVEAYSVVLSAAALALAVVLGGGGSLTLLLAIFQSRRVRKYSYTLVLVFFFLCCGLDLLWSPMELAHLLSYHHSLHNPTRDFAVATFAVYIFLVSGLAILIAAFCAENVLRMAGVFSPMLRNAWPLSVCLSMLLLCLLMALAFLSTSLHQPPHPAPLTYLILHAASSATRVTILTLLVLMVVVGAVAVVLAGVLAIRRGVVKTSESFLSGQSNESNNGSAVPRFLVNQAGASTEDVDKISMSASSSKLPDIIGPDVTPATPVKSPAKLADLSAPSSRGPTMLGVNMAQVLGRRRHTICQIGDSSAPTGDPINKAKQYNYVRKFSVDISALQAQLENPKLFKDMLPFASHQDLSQKPKEGNKPPPQEPRAPLVPLPDLKPRSEAPDSGGGITLSVPPRPPVITVSEDVREDMEGEIQEEEQEEEEEKGKGGGVSEDLNFKVPSAEYAPAVDKMNLTDIPRLPVTQPVDEEDEEEEEDENNAAEKRAGNPCGDEEEDTSYKSNNNRLSDRDQDFVKMTLLMTLTFFLCTFPLFLVEAMRTSLHPHTYVNISTCARALSVIQTIIYPHIVICMDGVVHRAVQRLKQRASRVCSLTDRDGLEVPPEQASSNTSQM